MKQTRDGSHVSRLSMTLWRYCKWEGVLTPREEFCVSPRQILAVYELFKLLVFAWP